MVRTCFIALIVLSFALPAHASFIHYTFSGANGLSGSFDLAIDTPSSTSCDPNGILGCSYLFASPFNSLSGTYGVYSFSGVSRLDIYDLPSTYGGFCCMDSWIVRAGIPVLSPLTGNVVDGRSVTGLNMFIYACCGGTLFSGAPLTPPRLTNPDRFNFQYTVSFSDGSFEGGELNTLAVVPELPSVALLAFGLIGLLVGLKHRGLHRL
jgi:hypothetical protein